MLIPPLFILPKLTGVSRQGGGQWPQAAEHTFNGKQGVHFQGEGHPQKPGGYRESLR